MLRNCGKPIEIGDQHRAAVAVKNPKSTLSTFPAVIKFRHIGKGNLQETLSNLSIGFT